MSLNGSSQSPIKSPKSKSYLGQIFSRASKQETRLSSQAKDMTPSPPCNGKVCGSSNLNPATTSRSPARSVPQLAPIVTSISTFEPGMGPNDSLKPCSNTAEAKSNDSPSMSFNELQNGSPKLSELSRPEPSYQNRSPSVHDLNQPSSSSPTIPKLFNAARVVLKSSKSSMNLRKSKPQLASTMELTPLSTLIKQSYKDIEMLRALRVTQSPNDSFSSNNSGNSSFEGTPLSGSVPIKDQKGNEVDFERIEENLRRFGDLYSQFLKDGGNEGKPAEEVHLVAMVCKRHEMVTGPVGGAGGISKLNGADSES